jgi:hypothetical protein
VSAVEKLGQRIDRFVVVDGSITEPAAIELPAVPESVEQRAEP